MILHAFKCEEASEMEVHPIVLQNKIESFYDSVKEQLVDRECLKLNLSKFTTFSSHVVAVLIYLKRNIVREDATVILTGLSEKQRDLLKALRLDLIYVLH